MVRAFVSAVPLAAAVWTPVMHDDFTRPLDDKIWKFHGSASHKFPDELQLYQEEDAYTEKGNLVMRTRFHNVTKDGVTYPYTSGAIDSSAGFNHTFGRWQGFIQLPPDSDGQVWPALWMTPLGTAPKNRSCWPMCGEIDIMEFWAGRYKTPSAKSSYHMGDACSNDTLGTEVGRTSADDVDKLTSYNLFALEWTADKIEFFFNDRSLGSISGAKYDIPTWPMGWRINQAVCGRSYCLAPEGPVQHDSYFRLDFVSVLEHKTTDFCDDGLQTGLVCCPKSCGVCGGLMCGARAGGSNCCEPAVIDSKRFCNSSSDTGCIVPTVSVSV